MRRYEQMHSHGLVVETGISTCDNYVDGEECWGNEVSRPRSARARDRRRADLFPSGMTGWQAKRNQAQLREVSSAGRQEIIGPAENEAG